MLVCVLVVSVTRCWCVCVSSECDSVLVCVLVVSVTRCWCMCASSECD